MPSWDQLLLFLSRFSACDLTLFVIVLHMIQEEVSRQRFERWRKNHEQKEE